MSTRRGACFCGALTVEARGEPVRISVCHCLNCKQRTGSAFSAQARWRDEDIMLTGTPTRWTRPGDEGGSATFMFCPTCGAPIAYTLSAMPGLTAIPIGAFADPGFPAPSFSVFESRKHAWVEIVGDGVQRD